MTKQRVHRVLENAWGVYQRSKNSISTKKLNEKLKYILMKNPPPAEFGKVVQIKYATQVSNNPKVLAFYTNSPKKIKNHYSRYLENQLREVFDLKGIPVVLSFRSK